MPGHKYTTDELLASFWSKVDASGDCWLWKGIIANNGYGVFQIHKKSYGAHRISYMLEYGVIANEICVCHRCDVRNCVNPKHLWLGTKGDNYRDAMNKKRHSFGEKNGMSVLTEELVRQLRARYVPGYGAVARLSREFGLPYSSVWCAVTGATWKHVI